MLVLEAAEEAAAAAGDLARIEREPLILGESEVDRRQLLEPGGAAVLLPASSDAAEAGGFVPDADLAELDAGAEEGREVAHQGAEVDPLLRGEVDGQTPAVPLPFGVTHLHEQLVRAHPLDDLAPHLFLGAAPLVEGADVLLAGAADHRAQRLRIGGARHRTARA